MAGLTIHAPQAAYPFPLLLGFYPSQVSIVVIVSDGNLRQVRVLHLVSSGGVAGSLQQSLFMPLLTRMPKQRVKAQVVSLAPGFAPGAVLRQNGVPVHDVDRKSVV